MPGGEKMSVGFRGRRTRVWIPVRPLPNYIILDKLFNLSASVSIFSKWKYQHKNPCQSVLSNEWGKAKYLKLVCKMGRRLFFFNHCWLEKMISSILEVWTCGEKKHFSSMLVLQITDYFFTPVEKTASHLSHI